jgi:hypothetical protein
VALDLRSCTEVSFTVMRSPRTSTRMLYLLTKVLELFA